MSASRDSSQRPLRLLSLDGGGIRGYSELMILQLLMHRVAWDTKDGPLGPDETLPKPCEYFDLIGGTSTRGIIAILLGRMQLSVDQCLEIYERLALKVFGQKRFGWGIVRSKFDHKILEVVKEEVKKCLCDEDALMYDPEHGQCRAFVCTTPTHAIQRDNSTLIRTYLQRSNSPNNLPEFKIWEAIRATSAAPTFFDPIRVHGAEYVDGGIGCNNPCRQVYEEAVNLWPERETGCIISLGTGMPKVLSLPDIMIRNSLWPKEWIEALIRMASMCEEVHQSMTRDLSLRRKYFRFNVQQGMQTISLEEHERLGEVETHTEVYLNEADVVPKVDEAVERLIAAGEGTADS